MTAHPIIVTAADQRYWRCLYQFLRDVERHGLQQGHAVLAYDLGLEPATRDFLARRFAWCALRAFRFEDHPPHVAMAESSYAWKPLLLAELVAAEARPVLWLDSATLFRTRDLASVWDVIRREGVYVAHGQTPLRERCDPLTLQALDVPASVRRRPEIAAGVIGLDAGKENIRALVSEWAHHARIEAHIMPRRPRLSWHKPEQALLSILLYREEEAGRLRLGHDEIDVSSSHPLVWMSSRNKVGAKAPLWADPFVRLYHRGYKSVDQALWRWRNWRDTRLHGFHRRLKEHFSVLLHDGGRVRRIPAPDGCYYADPFLITDGARTALLVERFDYRSCRGDLCAVPLDAALRPGPPVPIIPRARHMSFPYVFAHEGVSYLVPETCGDQAVEIFRCTSFPDAWEPVALALEGVDAADTVIFPHDGLWWLVTSVRPADGGGRHLAIWHAEDFRTGPWRPHPVNEKRLYRQLPFSSGRNGGAILRRDGLLLRPVHWNRRFYGEGLALMRIECLTPADYRETPFTGDHPAARILADFSPHHLSMAGPLAVFDIRDRARGWGGLWPFRLKAPSLPCS